MSAKEIQKYRNEEQFDLRPSPSLREFAQRQYIQKNAYDQQMTANLKKKRELEEKQRIVEEYQKERERQNQELMRKGAGFGGKLQTPQEDGKSPYIGPKGSMFDPEEGFKHKQRLKLLKPGISVIFDDFGNPIQPKDTLEETRGTFAFGKKLAPQEVDAQPKLKYYEESGDEEEPPLDYQTQLRMEEVAKQNEAIKRHLEQLRRDKVHSKKANKFKDELERLNALESKMYDYNRNLDNVKQMNRIGDELTRQARNQALAAIKAGQMRKDNLVKMAIDSKTTGKDPWARKMLQKMFEAQLMGVGHQNPLMQQQLQTQVSPNKNGSSDQTTDTRAKKKTDKQIRKLNEELDQNKKALEELKGEKAAVNLAANNQMSKDEVQKIIDETVGKMKPEIEKRAREAGAGPGDIVTLPNGVTIIKPRDPTKPPIFVMPDEPGKELRHRLNKSSSSLSSSVTSLTESSLEKPNPMMQMMLGMLMNKNMQLLMGTDDQSSSSGTSKSTLHNVPIVINQPYYPPQQPAPLPPIARPKSVRSQPPLKKPTQKEPLPPIMVDKAVGQTDRPKDLPQKPPSVRSIVSESVLGNPVLPPLKMPHFNQANDWGMDAPKPPLALDPPSYSSIRDEMIASQVNEFVRAGPVRINQPTPQPIIIPQYLPPPRESKPRPRTPPKETPKAPEPPLPKTDDTYKRASYKVWKVFTAIKFMKFKEDLNKAALKPRQEFSKSYFREDLAAIKEQNFLMVKSRLESVVTEVVENEEYTNLSSDQPKLDEVLGKVCEELLDLSTIKKDAKFDNPFVLSFFANTAYPGCWVPDDYYTAFEFNRLTFSSTGQIKLADDNIRQMIGGGMILIRGVCKELFFNAKKYFTELPLTETSERNLDALGVCIYNAYIETIAQKCSPVDSNTVAITQNDEKPAPSESTLGYKEDNDGEDVGDNDLLAAVPDVSNFAHDASALRDKISELLENLSRFILMQAEDERLPLFKKKLDQSREVATKMKKIDPDVTEALNEYVREKEKQLKL